ncbi:hypothetical protein XENOCAPTIV_018558, partial [Xenoophorus captivus]
KRPHFLKIFLARLFLLFVVGFLLRRLFQTEQRQDSQSKITVHLNYFGHGHFAVYYAIYRLTSRRTTTLKKSSRSKEILTSVHMALLLLLTDDVQLNPGPNTSADAGIEQLLTNEPGLVAGDRGSGGVGGDVLESVFYIQEHVGQHFHQTVLYGERGVTSGRAAACYLATASDVSNQKIDGASTLSTNVCTNHFHLGDLGITPLLH